MLLYRSALPLLGFVTVLILTLTTLSFWFSGHGCAHSSDASHAPVRAKCVSDCTSKEGVCVDWDGRVCSYVSGAGCCDADSGALPETTQQSYAQLSRASCETTCCTGRFSECVAWCTTWSARRKGGSGLLSLPQDAFETCRDACRLGSASWYGGRSHRRWRHHEQGQLGSGSTFSPTPMHCFAYGPEPSPELLHELDTHRSVEPTTASSSTTEEESNNAGDSVAETPLTKNPARAPARNASVEDGTKPVRLIEWH